MQKSQVSGFLANLFAKLNGLWILSLMPDLKKLITSLEEKAMAENDAILAHLPATFNPKDVVDALFSLAEGWFPQYAALLKWAQGLADALLQNPPVVPSV